MIKEELVKLIKLKIPITNYKGKLSNEGFLVKVGDAELTLPNGYKGKCKIT